MPGNPAVVESNPLGAALFLLLLSFPTFLHQWSVLNQVPHKEVNLLLSVVKRNRKNGCPAEPLRAKWSQ